MPPTDTCAPTRYAVYAQSFILSAAAALTAYFMAPLFLTRGIRVELIGVVYALAAVGSVTLLLSASRLFTRFGNYRSFLAMLSIATVATALLAFGSGPIITALSFTALTVSIAGAGVLLDIFLKGSMTGTSGEGATRATFITASNIAWVAFPVAAGFISTVGARNFPFLIAAVLFALASLVAMRTLADTKRHTYRDLDISGTLATIARNPDLRGVFVAQFLLRIFYALMVIYTPVYLTRTAGLSLDELGIVTSIAMAAFLFFEPPVGFLSDTRYGEKEFMLTGFVILAVSVAFIPSMPAGHVALWGILLFVTRIGAAIVEITTESYFFKKTGAEDVERVGVFRALGPISYVVGPLAASAIVAVAPVSFVFVALAALLTLGVPATLLITDTR